MVHGDLPRQHSFETTLRFTGPVPADSRQLLLLLLLFLTFSALVANPKKTTLHGGQSRSWSAEQGKKRKRKSLAAPPPPPARCSFGVNAIGTQLRDPINSGLTRWRMAI